MTGHAGRNHAADRSPQEIKVADDIENLVTRKLVGEPELGVEDLLVIHQNAITESSSVHQSELFQFFDILEKSESSRRGDFLFKSIRALEDIGMFLYPYRFRVVEDIADSKGIRRFDADGLTVFLMDPISPANNDFRPLFFLFLYPPLLDQMAKFQGGAIHDRYLALHLDQQIRDPVTMKHGEKMLHGANHNAFATKRGGVTGRADIIYMGRHTGVGRDAAE